MRQLRRYAVLLSLLAAFFTGSAFADSTVTMQLVGVGGNNGGGVYTYPYNFSINGSGSTPLVCDAFDNEVTIGESWTATVSSLLSGNGLFGSNPTAYKAAGLIFEGILAGNINPTAGNWAIWGLFSSNAVSNPYFTSSGASSIYNQYLNAALTAPDSLFSNLVIYTPVSGTQSSGGVPQEYIGIKVPEGSEIAMLLTLMLFGLTIFTMRKRLGLKSAMNLQ